MPGRLGNHIRGNVVAYIALFFAIGGVSYAAVDLAKNSISAREIKRNAVRASEIKRNAVRSSEVKKDALKGSDVNEATLAAVPSALSATDAQNASAALNAINAENATSALNADQVDGLDSSAFQRVRNRVFQVGRADAQNFATGSTLAELTVPEGTYLALAKLSIIHPNAGNDATTTCDLSVPGPLDDSQRSRMGGGGTVGDQLGFPLATTFTGGGQLSLSCSNFSGANDAFNIKLIALRVD